MEIAGSVAVVTGGASGLGGATTQLLVAGGAKAAILDLPRSPGEKVAAEIGENAIFCPCDVTNADEVEAAIEKTVQTFGAIHIDVNCAGIGWATRTVTRQGPHPIEPFVKVLEVNLIGTMVRSGRRPTRRPRGGLSE
jgi:NAD(P)-dependent dehydrogenase (short-subunit alcohol dehydrogenase family)